MRIKFPQPRVAPFAAVRAALQTNLLQPRLVASGLAVAFSLLLVALAPQAVYGQG